MSKKLIISLMLIGILAFGAGLGTFAYFTSTATSSDNVFETGTLVIDNPGTLTTDLEVDNIYPTWTTSKTVTVHNSGSLVFKYRMSVTPLTGNILYDGATPLQVSVNGDTWTNIDDLGYVELGQIAAGTEGTFTIGFKLPAEANNDYQDATADFDIVFDATQVENPGYTQ